MELEKEFEINGGMYKEYRIGDLFEPLDSGFVGAGKKIGSAMKEWSNTYCIPLTCAKVGDNGIMYWAKKGDFITQTNALSVIADGAISAGLVYAQPEEAGAYSHSYFIKIKNTEVSSAANLYLSTVLTKVIYPKFSRDYSPRWERIKNIFISLPTTKDQINFSYMGNVIHCFEEDCVNRLNEFLELSDFQRSTLSKDEKNALLKSRQGNVIWKEFKVGDVFEYLNAPYKGANPRQDNVSCIKTLEFDTPVVCAKHGDNGVMYWGRHSDFTTFKNVLSVIYNGAIAAGLVYAQEDAVGVFTDSYLIRYKDKKVSFMQNLFLKTTLQKAIYEKYSRDIKAIWKRISENEINLPVTSSGEIDWDFMQNIISAEGRLALRGVIEWKNMFNENP